MHRRAVCIALLLFIMLFPAEYALSEQDGLDKKLQPSNEWIEHKVSPYSQWVESVLHDWQLQRKQPQSANTSPFSDRPAVEGELSEQQAAALALAQFTGEVLSVRAKTFQQQACFRVQILGPGGRVKVFYIHRRSGAVVPRRLPSSHSVKQNLDGISAKEGS